MAQNVGGRICKANVVAIIIIIIKCYLLAFRVHTKKMYHVAALRSSATTHTWVWFFGWLVGWVLIFDLI